MHDFPERPKTETEKSGDLLVFERSDIRNDSDKVRSFIRCNTYNGTSLTQYSMICLSSLAKVKEVSQGAFFIIEEQDGRKIIRFLTGYASIDPEETHDILELGEGFSGQVVKDGKLMNISDIPEGYLIESGLGKGSPVSLLLFPVKKENEVIAVIEVSSFQRFTSEDENFFTSVSSNIAEQIMKCKGNS